MKGRVRGLDGRFGKSFSIRTADKGWLPPSSSGTDPVLVANRRGDLLAGWLEARVSDRVARAVVAERSKETGRFGRSKPLSASAPGPGSDEAAVNRARLQLNLDDRGRAIANWVGCDRGYKMCGVQYSRRTTAGEWRPAVTLSQARASVTKVTMNSKGRAVAVWATSGDGTSNNLWTAIGRPGRDFGTAMDMGPADYVFDVGIDDAGAALLLVRGYWGELYTREYR